VGVGVQQAGMEPHLRQQQTMGDSRAGMGAMLLIPLLLLGRMQQQLGVTAAAAQARTIPLPSSSSSRPGSRTGVVGMAEAGEGAGEGAAGAERPLGDPLGCLRLGTGRVAVA
jgi:hypothetical protein